MFALLALTVLHLAPPTAKVPYRAPQLASSENLVALAYGSGRGIYVATSTNEGQDFSKPVKIAEAPILPLSRHRGPRIVISKGAIVVTAVTGSTVATGPHAHGLPSDGDLFAWQSTDSGKTWSKAVRINDVPAAAREGLHTLAGDGQGRLFAAWLDLRQEGTRLYGAWSKDSGATWTVNVLLYESPEGTICQCCHPFAAFSDSGRLDVMWRNCLGGARDMYLLRSTEGGRSFSKPEKLGKGTWMINACPMDGGGLTHADGRTIAAWRRDLEIFMVEPGEQETRIGEGKDVAVAASQGQVYVLWVKGTQLVASIGGKTEVLAEHAAVPALTALPTGGVLAAWEEDSGISVRRLQ
jgi:hypothetical protein